MTIFDVFTLFGGLAMFLYGMSAMGEGLERKAGGKLKDLLERLSSNPFKGFLLGLGVTAIIQSSSATTVMVVGFVNSGVMQLNQAIGIIMGANVGTTVTAWILSLSGLSGDSLFIKLLKPSSFSPIMAVIGIILYMFSKRSSKKDTGSILLGFAILMFGMQTMSSAVAPLADMPEFANLLLLFSNPIFGVLAGAILTGIIQSSSASVGILQAISSTGSLTYGTAIPIIMGQNIGTCVTALLSSIGTGRNAKRAAMVHLYFNIIGTTIFLTGYGIIVVLFKPVFSSMAINAAGIALVHTSFNLIATAIMLPFASLLEKLAYMTVKDGKEKDEPFELSLLDERIMATPSVAVEQCRRVANMMAEFSVDACRKAMTLLDTFDTNTIEEVSQLEKRVDVLEDRMGTYLLSLGRMALSQNDTGEVALLLHSIGDLERIGDHALGLARTAEELYTKDISFSPLAQADILVLRAALNEIMSITVNAFTQQDRALAHRVEPLEQVIDLLRFAMKERHIDRLQAGECTQQTGFIFSDLITNCQRISDHCSNIAVYLIRTQVDKLDAHEYLNDIKSGKDTEYTTLFNEYSNKYQLTVEAE
ncbi:MAG: Na/Pi cotransporter family protein [Clostridiaceae bacterium]|nr:Na/Pi cotransporter family protein [Clostridiaceae bacterium]